MTNEPLSNAATKADLERLQSTLIKWIVGACIALFIALIAVANLFHPVS